MQSYTMFIILLSNNIAQVCTYKAVVCYTLLLIASTFDAVIPSLHNYYYLIKYM